MTDYIVPQFITNYEVAGVFHPDDPAEPHNDQPLSSVQPTLIGNTTDRFDRYNFAWRLPDDFGTFASLGIIGFKVVGEFDGSGPISWDWSIDNPGYPGAPEWPGGGADGSNIAWNNGYDPSALVHVSGSTTYEWTFALTDTASDPTYGGSSFSDPLGDLEVSLHATETHAGFDHTVGTVGASFDEAVSVQVLRWDLVLFTEIVTGTGTRFVTRLWPRDDNLGLGTTNRIHPAPRANRIVGGQP